GRRRGVGRRVGPAARVGSLHPAPGTTPSRAVVPEGPPGPRRSASRAGPDARRAVGVPAPRRRPRRAGPVLDVAGGARLRGDGRVPAVRRGRRAGASSAVRADGGVAGCGRQPRERGASRPVTRRGRQRTRRPRTGTAPSGVRRLRPGLPELGTVRGLPRPAQAAPRRPGRGPCRRGAPRRPGRRRWRPRPAAPQPVRTPARRRPHEVGARGAAELGGQRRAARGRCPVARAAPAVLPTRGHHAVRLRCRRGRAGAGSGGVRDRLPRDAADRPAADRGPGDGV
ncbi:MAG: Flp pilus assembly protein TadB, partial [uncultured Nocardioidaceae bacterium]